MNREFLERSLEDLDREFLAGDLTERDYRRLRSDYEARLRGEGPPPRPPARRAYVAAATVFVVLVGVGAGVLIAQTAGRRTEGGTITGGGPVATAPPEAPPPPTLPDDLARCTTLDGGDAIDCFTSYTDGHPDDPDGYTQFGLFAISAGIDNGSAELLDAGEAFLRRALELDPADLTARVYLAVVLDRTGRAEAAAAECTRLADVDVPPDLAGLVDFACS